MMETQIGNIPIIPGNTNSGIWDVIEIDDKVFRLSLSVHSGETGKLRLLLASGPLHPSPIAENVVRRISEMIDPGKLKGTLITVHDFASKWNELPNADKPVYPGWPHGDFVERVAYEITSQLLGQVDYAVFLDGPSKDMNYIPHAALFTVDDPPMTSCHPEILKMMGHDLILERQGMRGSLAIEAQREFALPVLVAQLDDIDTTIDKENWLTEKVLNFMAWMGMIDFKPIIPDRTYVATSEFEIRSVRDGNLDFNCSLGDFISEGDRIGVIRGKKNKDVSEIINSHDGYIVSKRRVESVLVEDEICTLLKVSFIENKPGTIFCETTLDNCQLDVQFRENMLFKGLQEE